MRDARERDDAEYWDALAERVVAGVERQARASPLQWLSQSPLGWIAASLLVGGVAAFLMLADARSGSDINRWSDAIAPTDDVGRTMALREDAPAIGALLLGERARSER